MSKQAQLQGQNVLITQSSLVRVGGSEVQAYELAHYFITQGCQVTLYAWVAASPMRDFVESLGVKVITSSCEASRDLHLHEFDLVWVQHEVLPVNFITELTEQAKPRPRFIFAHMSPYCEVHLEQPYIYGLEDGLADLVVFNAPGTLEAQKDYFEKQDKLGLYPNPAPEAFSQRVHTMREHIKKVLVVSNHPPDELLQAGEVLRAQGISLDVLNDVNNGHNKITTPELLDEYDCVVSIGKTVQYCLVQGVPVFVYDYFGGPGYLHEQNFEQAAYYNFSGRLQNCAPSLVQAQRESDSRMDPQSLAEAIVSGYEQACNYQSRHREQFISRYSIEGVFKQLIEQLSQCPSNSFTCDAVYQSYVMRHSQMVADYNRSIQYASNPTTRFYQQAVRVFLGSTVEMKPQDLTPDAYPLYESTDLEIDSNGCQVVRVDFGEEPCVITGLQGHDSQGELLSITTDADIEFEGVYLFMTPDPKVYFSGENPLHKLSVHAKVYPLSHVPADALSALSQEISMRQQQQKIQLDKWYNLRNNPCVRLLLRLRKLSLKLIKGKA